MINNEIVKLEIQLDGKMATEGAESILAALSDVKVMLIAVSGAFSKAMNFEGLLTNIFNLTDALCVSAQEIGYLTTAIETLQSSNQWVDMLSVMGNICTMIQTMIQLTKEHIVTKVASKAEDIAIIALYALDYVKAFGAMITQIAASTAAWIANTAVKVANTAAQWAQIAATTAWNALCAVATTVTTAFGAAMAFLTSPIGLVVVAVAALIAIVVLLVKNWDTVKAAALSVWTAIKSAFGSAWKWFKETVLDPLVGGFKGMINGIIGFLNGLIAGIVKGINGVIGLLNKLNFDVPDWVPLIGGQTFGFNLAPLTAPKIPLLAQGAVLPANKPFLAVVGDQKHGTNIEAPLATIQQALADVLAQQGNDIHIRFTGDLAQPSSMLHGAEHICPMKDAALSARGSSK